MAQGNAEQNIEQWNEQEPDICLYCGEEDCYCCNEPFKARETEDGLGVVDVIGKDKKYHVDILCTPRAIHKAKRLADMLNAESRRRRGKC